jgi:hypothetical protein
VLWRIDLKSEASEAVFYQRLRTYCFFGTIPAKREAMKHLILVCLSALVLVTVTACSSDSDKSATTTSSGATMQTDSKSMQHR